MTSSPRWLIALTAIRPEPGFLNGRDVSQGRLCQASTSISALRVVFEGLVGVVRTQEVGVADEEAGHVVVGVDEPAGEIGGLGRADVTGTGIEQVHALDRHLNAFIGGG